MDTWIILSSLDIAYKLVEPIKFSEVYDIYKNSMFWYSEMRQKDKWRGEFNIKRDRYVKMESLFLKENLKKKFEFVKIQS